MWKSWSQIEQGKKKCRWGINPQNLPTKSSPVRKKPTSPLHTALSAPTYASRVNITVCSHSLSHLSWKTESRDHSHNRGGQRSDGQVIPDVDGFSRGDDVLRVRGVQYFAHCLWVTNEHLEEEEEKFYADLRHFFLPFNPFISTSITWQITVRPFPMCNRLRPSNSFNKLE